MQRRYHTRNSMDHRFRLISINSDLLVIDPQLQNVMAAHGQGRLIKGLSHIKPHFSSSKKVLDRLVSLESHRNRNSSCRYTRIYPFQEGPEHLMTNGTCAFQRPKFAYGMASASWKNITAENLEFARSVTRDLVSIVAIGQQEQLGEIKQGYGNYGTWGFCSLYGRGIWLTCVDF